MSTTTRRMTAEEFFRMPADGLRHELVEGEVRTVSPAGSEHGVIAMNLGILLGSFVKQNRLGLIFAAESGFITDRNPDSVLAPDISFIHRDRVPTSGPPEAFWPGVPDLAVEVISPGDTRLEIVEKRDRWLATGVRIVWELYPGRKEVEVHRLGEEVVILGEADELDGRDVVPGFRCRVAELFE